MQTVIDIATAYYPLFVNIVAAAAAAAAVLPQAKEGSVWATVRKVIDWLALNVANAKNAKNV